MPPSSRLCFVQFSQRLFALHRQSLVTPATHGWCFLITRGVCRGFFGDGRSGMGLLMAGFLCVGLLINVTQREGNPGLSTLNSAVSLKPLTVQSASGTYLALRGLLTSRWLLHSAFALSWSAIRKEETNSFTAYFGTLKKSRRQARPDVGAASSLDRMPATTGGDASDSDASDSDDSL
jgi:hypothetical protein